MTENVTEAPEDPREEWYNAVRPAPFVEKTEAGYVFDLGEGEKALVEDEEFIGDEPKAGEDVTILVERPYGDYWTASVRKLEKLRIWDRMGELVESGEPVEGTIVATNRGGLSVDIGLRAFVPKSQIDVHRVEDFSPYLGRTEQFKIIEFDKRRGNVVASRRELLEAELEESRGDLLENLSPGQEYDGIVRNVVDFGAFIDIGGIEGLLHSSNMSWGRVDHPSELFRPGDKVRVIVLDYQKEKDRLSLGRKQLLSDPWDKIEEKYEEGQTVQGKVVSLADFGAFVEIAPGLEGLVHVTELSWLDRINHPSEVLDIGADIKVKIAGVDAEKRRLSLSIKRLEQNPWEAVAEKYPPGTKLTGKIVNIAEFGLFVEIEPKVDGLVHVSDISWTENIEDPAALYEVGQEVETVVLDIDADAARASLGIKQLADNPWDSAEQVAKVGEKIKVTITRLTDFGAFATIVDGVEGLIHISELSEDRIEHPQRVVRPGQEVEVLVMSFDRGNERIGLSLKRDVLEENEVREYTDEGGATSTLGDLLRDQLGLKEEAPEAVEEEPVPEEKPEEAPAVEEASAPEDETDEGEVAPNSEDSATPESDEEE